MVEVCLVGKYEFGSQIISLFWPGISYITSKVSTCITHTDISESYSEHPSSCLTYPFGNMIDLVDQSGILVSHLQKLIPYQLFYLFMQTFDFTLLLHS